MLIRKAAAIAVMTIAATGIAAGTSHAAPETSPDVSYKSEVVDKAVVTTIDAGAFRVSGDGSHVDLQNDKGATLVSLPLAFNLGDVQFPFDKTISEDGKTLTLKPNLDPARSKPKPAVEPAAAEFAPVASPEENKKAMDEFQSKVGVATQIGSLTGTIIGAVIGCVLGLPAFVAGCLPGLVTGAGIGGVAGTIIAGGPTAIVAGMDLVKVLNAPPGAPA